MKDQEFMVEKIRSQYTEQEHTELDALKALDASFAGSTVFLHRKQNQHLLLSVSSVR